MIPPFYRLALFFAGEGMKSLYAASFLGGKRP
ncbi:hypothetical protein BH10PSE11_BH10PSE11_37940 [soil metagenome]